MKVIFIGHFLEQSGSGEASRNYLRAIHAAGIEIAARPVLLNQTIKEIPLDIQSFINTSIDGATHTIQHVLPHHLNYDGNYKNICIFVYETSRIELTGWFSRIKLMDEIWVPNDDQKIELLNCGIKQYVATIPHACDVTEYNKQHNKGPNYVFYSIGEFVRRKNFAALIKAFHNTFSLNEPVELLIKTNKFGHDNIQAEIVNFCNKIKFGLKLYKTPEDYSREKVITNRLTREEILNLHYSSDCYVNPSYGESWCYPCFDAMAVGNTVISNDEGGPAYYLEGYDNKYLVENREEPVYGMNDTFQDINTAHESWKSIDTIELSRCMRQAYNNRKISDSQHYQNFSYEKIGRKIYNALSR